MKHQLLNNPFCYCFFKLKASVYGSPSLNFPYFTLKKYALSDL